MLSYGIYYYFRLKCNIEKNIESHAFTLHTHTRTHAHTHIRTHAHTHTKLQESIGYFKIKNIVRTC